MDIPARMGFEAGLKRHEYFLIVMDVNVYSRIIMKLSALIGVSIFCFTLVGYQLLRGDIQTEMTMRMDTVRYSSVELPVTNLSARLVMEKTLARAQTRNLAPASAARLYAYIAAVYADVLDQTANSAQASRAAMIVLDGLEPPTESEKDRDTAPVLSKEVHIIVDRYMVRSKTDGYDLVWDQKIPADGWYIRNDSFDRGAMAGQWIPWLLSEDQTYTVGDPPRYGSLAEKAELAKVRFATHQRKEADYTSIAYWHGTSGFRKGSRPDNITPAGVWQNILFVEKGSTVDDATYAKAQKLLAQSIADSFIIAWRTKYQYNLRRPSMQDGNLILAFSDPPFPSYVSGHSTISKTAAEVLSYLFPDKADIWRANANDARNSRLLAGIHYSIDNMAGARLGAQIAADIIKPLDSQYQVHIPPDPQRSLIDDIVDVSIYGVADFISLLTQAADRHISWWRRTREDVYFRDDAVDAGLTGPVPGCGASWGDVDGDRDDDLYVAGCGQDDDALYRNDGGGSFENIIDQSGIHQSGHTAMGLWGDMDNDGDQDLFIVRGGDISSGIDNPGEPGSLYRNNGDGTFVDVTDVSGIAYRAHSSSASWGDYNNDSFLDLHISNYGVGEVTDDSLMHRSEQDILYRNNGDSTFTDVTETAGVGGYIGVADRTNIPTKNDPPVYSGMSFQSVWFDYDQDGLLDLFVATDKGVSPLYRNLGDGRFEDVTQKTGLYIAGTGMGVAVGDIDRTGCPGLYVTNFFQHYLWRNRCDGTFEEVAIQRSIQDTGVGWGVTMTDWDNNGALDLFVANTALSPVMQGPEIEKAAKRPNVAAFYRNDGNTLELATEQIGFDGPGKHMALAQSDYNNDGYSDLYLVNVDPNFYRFRNSLFTNVGSHKNNWLGVSLVGTRSNRDGIGAVVTVIAGDASQSAVLTAGSSFQSQHSKVLLFGLGENGSYDRIHVRWSGGATQTVEGGSDVNRVISIRQE